LAETTFSTDAALDSRFENDPDPLHGEEDLMNSESQPSDRNRPRKQRRHGYRGYGSSLGRGREDYGGAVHWGRGFGGLGFLGENGSALPPPSNLIPEELRVGASHENPPTRDEAVAAHANSDKSG
jgi:hypothetical protein